jgi:hypothetical protein
MLSCHLMIWLLPQPPLRSLVTVSKLSLFLSHPECRPSLLTKVVGRGGGGAKKYDDEKVCSSIHHSLLSAIRQVKKCKKAKEIIHKCILKIILVFLRTDLQHEKISVHFLLCVPTKCSKDDGKKINLSLERAGRE